MGNENETTLVGYGRAAMIFITIFSLLFVFFSLAIVGTVNVAAGSTLNSLAGGVGDQEIQEGEQLTQQQRTPEAIEGGEDTDSSVISSTVDNANTTSAEMVGAENSTLLYQNLDYGIEIRYPQDWIYDERDDFLPFDFGVIFVSPLDAFEAGTTLESGEIPEVPRTIGAVVMELPFENIDVRLLEDIVTNGLTSEGHQIISTNPNATLSDMPALEIVSTQPEDGTMGMQLWTVQGNRAYGVLYLNHESRFDQSLPIAQDMISSFTITNGTNTASSLTGSSNGNTTTIQQFQIPPVEEELVSPSTTVTSTTNGGIDNNQTTSLEAAKQEYLTVWNQTEFQIIFNTFIEQDSAIGYGIYEERENNDIFRPGETIQLYAEPVGFGHRPIIDDAGNTLYSVDLAADIIVSDVNGNELATIEDLPMSDIVSHRQNTELHLTLTLTQDSPFPAGDYIISYIVRDEVKGESFQIDKRITIATEVSGLI